MRLFRNDAVAEHAQAEWGTPISSAPPSWGILTVFFTMMAVALLGFLSTATFARREVASGVLALSLGEIRVLPIKAGVITDIYVSEGQGVTHGQILARVSTEQDLTAGTLGQQLMEAVNAQLAALRTRLQALDEGAPSERRALAGRLAGERNQIDQMKQSLASREERLAVAKNAFESGRMHSISGAISGDTERQRQYDYLTQQQSMRDFGAQLAQLEGVAAQDQAALVKLASDQTQSRANLLEQIAALEERQMSVAGTDGYVLKAKVTGRVTALQAKVGQLVDSSRPLLTLVPQGSELLAEVYLPSRAIGFIKKGQRVRLRYDAFPSEQFGAARGTVEDLSATVLKPDEIGAPLSVKEPVYRIIVRPEKTAIAAYGIKAPLRSGMALKADVVLEERTFLRLLLDPLRAAGARVLGDG